MSKPIYADPELDGAADPTVIRNRETGAWWMFYTVRRPRHAGPGFEWIHGTPIGIAVSPDGVHWRYRGQVAGLDPPGDAGTNTHWAPEVIWGLGEYHMYLSYIRGVPDRWEGHDRRIVHFTSPDLVTWTRRDVLELSSTRVIDAAVALCPDGSYRLWYKDEADGSSTWSAISTNLHDWTLEGRTIPGRPDGFPHEGPNVFALGGHIWMIVDEWRGMGVFRSDDGKTWTRQGLILEAPGEHAEDRRFARHGDVVAQEGWAQLYYFTHPGWEEAVHRDPPDAAARRTVIHAARLTVKDGVLVCDRDAEPQKLEPFSQM